MSIYMPSKGSKGVKRFFKDGFREEEYIISGFLLRDCNCSVSLAPF